MELFDGEFLPSYEQATEREWLGPVAPYVSPRDYARLCRVSKRFYAVFAPLLWNDPVKTARELGLDAADDIRFCRHFFLKHAKKVRVSTLSLVHSLDLSDLAHSVPGLALNSMDSNASTVLQSLPSIVPALRCILLDGHPHIDANFLARPLAPEVVEDASFEGPLMLSLRDCHTPLAARLFKHPYFANLVYLDVSNIPGSVKSLIGGPDAAARPQTFPHLRILKAEGLEMDDGTVKALLTTFRTQLWSLDLSRNKLSAEILDWLPRLSFPPVHWRSDVHFDVEGVVVDPFGPGSDLYGPFFSLKESQWSETFDHPQRYRTSAPASRTYAYEIVRDRRPLHPAGAAPINDDSARAVKNVLSGGEGYPILDMHDVRNTAICRPVCSGITHLYLNENHHRLTARGIERLIRTSGGNLERFECDSMLFRPGRSFLLPERRPISIPKTTKEVVQGILGAAHLFRPAYSAKLQALRIHHSLVTGVLSLEADSLTTMEGIWLAETVLYERGRLAYPQRFVPDMNPRLRSLTLTRIPRFSAGPTIDALINFLRLASVQERAIQDARAAAASPRGPPLLAGLRHIRLEFDHDPREELSTLDLDHGDLDASNLVEWATDEFSFFEDSNWVPSPSSPPLPSSPTSLSSNKPPPPPPPSANRPSTLVVSQPDGEPSTTTAETINTPTPPSTNLPQYSLTQENADEYITRHMTWHRGPPTEQQQQQQQQHAFSFSARVWIGTSTLGGANEAVNAYMRNLTTTAADSAIEMEIEPASPCHVAAGVPPGAYIVSDAWDSILSPDPDSDSDSDSDSKVRKPTREELSRMRDVVGAVKEYRRGTKAAFDQVQREKSGEEAVLLLLGEPHFHWTGRLEIVARSRMDDFHEARFWR